MRAHLITLAVIAIGSSQLAVAQPGAQAETFFRQGRDLMAAGKFAEACSAFQASQRLEPAVSTLLNHAACREKNNQLATAWGLFLEAERLTRAATDAATRKLHKVAANRAQKLEARLSTLKIDVPAESRVGGLEIRRDGEVIDPVAWNQALPIDGGTYAIAARAPGNAEWTSTVTVGVERDAKTIDIPKLSAAALAPLPSPAPPPPPVQTRPSERSALSPLPLVLGGAALALGGGALGFHLWGNSTYEETKQGTDSQKLDAWRSANTKRYVAEGMGVAALGCAGVAVWLYVRGRRAPADEAVAHGIIITPVVASERAGIALTGRF